uniref:F-box domain-containing protein n=1 Tax=Parastrongyloides trichosuri TaxID=131310 RepID=A0A0N4ZLB3_PARTI
MIKYHSTYAKENVTYRPYLGLNNDKVDNNQESIIEKEDEEFPGKKAAMGVAHHKQIMIKILRQLDKRKDIENIRLTCKQFYALSFFIENQTQLFSYTGYWSLKRYCIRFFNYCLLVVEGNSLEMIEYPEEPRWNVIKFLIDNKKKIEYMISNCEKLRLGNVPPRILEIFKSVDCFKNIKEFCWHDNEIDELNINDGIFKSYVYESDRRCLLLITKYFKLINYSMSSSFIGYDNEGFKKTFGVNGILCDTPMYISYNLSLSRHRGFNNNTLEDLNSAYLKLKDKDKDLDLKIETLYTKVGLLSIYIGEKPIELTNEINIRCLSNDISKMINLDCLNMNFQTVGSEMFYSFIDFLPKRLKHLRLSDCNGLTYYHLCKISRICPLIETLSLTEIEMKEITIRRIILQFRNLKLLKVSFGKRYRIRNIIDSIVIRDGTRKKGMVRWPNIDGLYIKCCKAEEREIKVLEKMAEITPRRAGQFTFRHRTYGTYEQNLEIIVQRKFCDYDQHKIVFY